MSNGELLIVSQPGKKHLVVRSVDPDDGCLLVGDIALSAVLIAHANTYQEAETIVNNLQQ